MSKKNKENYQKIIKWFKSKWTKNQKCTICGSHDWIIEETFVTSIVVEGKNIKPNGNIYPQIMVICGNCGNSNYFNALIMGLAKTKPNH